MESPLCSYLPSSKRVPIPDDEVGLPGRMDVLGAADGGRTEVAAQGCTLLSNLRTMDVSPALVPRGYTTIR